MRQRQNCHQHLRKAIGRPGFRMWIKEKPARIRLLHRLESEVGRNLERLREAIPLVEHTRQRSRELKSWRVGLAPFCIDPHARGLSRRREGDRAPYPPRAEQRVALSGRGFSPLGPLGTAPAGGRTEPGLRRPQPKGGRRFWAGAPPPPESVRSTPVRASNRVRARSYRGSLRATRPASRSRRSSMRPWPGSPQLPSAGGSRSNVSRWQALRFALLGR